MSTLTWMTLDDNRQQRKREREGEREREIETKEANFFGRKT